ncbi:MAG: FtsX-like permease family protein [Planctomycetaceae bacterium]|nr:FtsX-like permease family protein [Planctomycetaceae bacterium]
MYKLHLLLTYLRSKALAILAMLGVSACVFLMLVSVSVMSGFLWKIERAAKGLFGDVVVESGGVTGMAYYDEFIAEVTKKVPEVKAGSPFILAYGILPVPGTDFRQTIQIAGIRLPQRVDVSDFEQGLYFEAGVPRPTFDPPAKLLLERIKQDNDQVLLIRQRETLKVYALQTDRDKLLPIQRQRLDKLLDSPPPVGDDDMAWLAALPQKTADDLTDSQMRDILASQAIAERIQTTFVFRRRAQRCILNTQKYRQQWTDLRNVLAQAQDKGPSASTTAALSQALVLLETLAAEDFLRTNKSVEAALPGLKDELKRARQDLPTVETVDALDRCLALTQEYLMGDAAHRVVLGLGIGGLSFRSPKGETIRHVVPGNKISLLMLPLGKATGTSMPQVQMADFTVIDDNHSDVSSIDSKFVYIPFETLQAMNNMAAEYDADDSKRVVVPARCSQIHFKVDIDKWVPSARLLEGAKGQWLPHRYSEEEILQDVSGKIQELWKTFAAEPSHRASGEVSIVTWRQLQRHVIGPIQQQRTLAIVMNSIMWGVSVLLIVVILYVIVVQKTADIGIVKAVGGSSWGVAGIFFGYGAIIGLIGSVLGSVLGWIFVRNINAIQDFTDATVGFRVWDPETFMFEKIPNEVDWSAAVWIIAGALVAGLIGAMIPAVRAARMQPVEALRYE